MSQFSDIYPSSLPGEELDEFSTTFPLSDDVNPFTEQSFSQQTAISLPDSFRTPSSTPPVPASLTRVGPDRRKIWALFEMENKETFIDWWLQTSSANNTEREGKKKFDFENSALSSKAWEHFKQIAHQTTGEPKVMCSRCSRVLDHPIWTENGTNSMRRHWAGEKCRKAITTVPKQGSNNGTLVGNIQESLESLELPNHKPITRIPCMAHVIQLSLKALLGKMEANPRNDAEEMEWTGDDEDPKEIIRTLNKVNGEL